MVGGALVAIGPTANVVLGVAIAAVWIAGVAVLLSALNGIFRTALYLYASSGTVPEQFPEQALASAFGPRSRGVGGVLR